MYEWNNRTLQQQDRDQDRRARGLLRRQMGDGVEPDAGDAAREAVHGARRDKEAAYQPGDSRCAGVSAGRERRADDDLRQNFAIWKLFILAVCKFVPSERRHFASRYTRGGIELLANVDGGEERLAGPAKRKLERAQEENGDAGKSDWPRYRYCI